MQKRNDRQIFTDLLSDLLNIIMEAPSSIIVDTFARSKREI